MDKYIQRFPDQLLEGLRIAENTVWSSLPRQPKQVVITGMGGSGIGAVIVRSLIGNHLSVPFATANNYRLPRWCNPDTLVICSSYSGNTEETLAAFEDARALGCMIACVTTGGKLLELAQAGDLPTIVIPGGMPPRSCVGYSIIGQLAVLQHAGVITADWRGRIQSAAHFLASAGASLRSEAQALAQQIAPYIPVIYSDILLSGVAVRWKQQINENAKMHAFDHTLPEMDHNELVAYVLPDPRCCAVFLRHSYDHPRMQQRFTLTKELMEGKAGCVLEVQARGEDIYAQLFSLIHLGDWLSVELAAIRGVDPIDITILEQLKTALGRS